MEVMEGVMADSCSVGLLFRGFPDCVVCLEVKLTSACTCSCYFKMNID